MTSGLSKKPAIDRSLLERLADERLRDFDVLQTGSRFAAAIYLGTYAVECLLKACICKTLDLSELPVTFKSHNLDTLLFHSGLYRRIQGVPQVYDNLKKTIIYLLPTNGGETAAIVVGLAFAVTLPISPIQVLWVNLATEITLTLAFAFEPAETDVMRRAPMPPKEPILSGQLVWRIGFVSVLMLGAVLGLFIFEMDQGVSVAAARTAAVNGIVACEIAYLFNTRFLLASSLTWRVLAGNWAAIAGVAAVVIGQVLFTYWAPMQAAFGTDDISLGAWGRAGAAGIALFLLVEAEKALMRRRDSQARSISSPQKTNLT